MPHVDVLRVEQIEISDDEQHTYGPRIRIVYSRSMYDIAMQRADELLERDKRISSSRIEFVFAARDEMYAIRASSFDIELLSSAPAENAYKGRGEKP